MPDVRARFRGAVWWPAVVMLMPVFAMAEQFTSTAYDLKTGKVLYTEHYDVQSDNGRWVSGTTRYLSPSGQQIAERKFDFSIDRYVPVYSLEQSMPEYREGITRIENGKIELFMVRDGERKSASIDRVKEMVADCGAQGYVLDHLDTLQSGGVLHFTLAVAGRVDSFALRARKAGDVDVNGAKAIKVRVELDSVLRLVLPPLELTVDPKTRRLLEYSGIANIKDPATKKAYSARIVFSYK
jgi:hypothetical protein